jgi:aryl-alcohol dehydrogenase-like predicted oxidoreductase
LGVCRDHGITLVAWGALADGLLTGKFTATSKISDDDHRSMMPEFTGNNFLRFNKCLKLLDQLAVNRGRKVGQLALRWVLDFEPFTCSLFGAKTDIQVMDNLGADGWSLTQEELSAIDTIVAEYRR